MSKKVVAPPNAQGVDRIAVQNEEDRLCGHLYFSESSDKAQHNPQNKKQKAPVRALKHALAGTPCPCMSVLTWTWKLSGLQLSFFAFDCFGKLFFLLWEGNCI